MNLSPSWIQPVVLQTLKLSHVLAWFPHLLPPALFIQISTEDFGAGEFQPCSQLVLIWFSPFLHHIWWRSLSDLHHFYTIFAPYLMRVLPSIPGGRAPLCFGCQPIQYSQSPWHSRLNSEPSKQGSDQGMSRDRQRTFYYLQILLFSLLLIFFSTTSEGRRNFLNFVFLPSSFKSQLSFWHTYNSIWTLSAHQKYSHLWFKIQLFLFTIQRIFPLAFSGVKTWT